jgi:hypothetical protein
MIKFCSAQALLSILSIIFALMRRIWINIIITILSVSFAYIGYSGYIAFNINKIFLHCIFSIAIFMPFLVYAFLDLLFINEEKNKSNQMTDSFYLMFFLTPFMFDVFCGVLSYLFIKKYIIYKEKMKGRGGDLIMSEIQGSQLIDLMLNIDGNNEIIGQEEIERHINSVDRIKCIICITNNRDSVILPCGHLIGCYSCLDNLFKNYNREKTCPICRNQCINYTKVNFN